MDVDRSLPDPFDFDLPQDARCRVDHRLGVGVLCRADYLCVDRPQLVMKFPWNFRAWVTEEVVEIVPGNLSNERSAT